MARLCLAPSPSLAFDGRLGARSARMKIEGKTFVVTGGASGLGEGTTRE